MVDEIKKVKVKKPSKNYFTQDTENAIVLYNNTLDSSLRSKIYEREIHYAFFKLTQNIIHTFKFHHTDVDNIEHLQQEIIVFLLTKIHLFNPENGAKAYSYFGTIVKRWLIVYTQKNYGNLVNNISIDSLNEHSNKDYFNFNLNSSIMNGGIDKIIDNEKEFEFNVLNEEDNDNPLSFFMEDYIKHCSNNLYTLFPKKSDTKIADAIIDLFRKRDMIPVFNKKALYIHIREKIDVKTPKITKISNKLYDIFKTRYLIFKDQGYLPS